MDKREMIKKLESLDEAITFAEQESSRVEGRIESEQQRLKKEFDLDEKDVPEKIEKLVKLEQKLNEEIEKDFSKLETEYEW